jgi:hypothetical protein
MSTTTFSGPVVSQNGFIENSFTTAQRDAIVDPQAGLLIYNTDNNSYEVYNGTGWQEAFGGSNTISWASGVDYTNAYFTGGGTPYVVLSASGDNFGIWQGLEAGTTLAVKTGEELEPLDVTVTLTGTSGSMGPGVWYQYVEVPQGFVFGPGNHIFSMDITPAPAPVPTITSLSTTSGTTAGGTSLNINGTGFKTDATTVAFGGTPATVNYVSGSTQVNVTTPAHAVGAVDVSVTTNGGTATSPNAFTYVEPPSGTTYTNGVDGTFVFMYASTSNQFQVMSPSVAMDNAFFNNAAADKSAVIDFGSGRVWNTTISSSVSMGTQASCYLTSFSPYSGNPITITISD